MTLKQAFFILRHGSAEGNHKYLEAVKVIEGEYNRQKAEIEDLEIEKEHLVVFLAEARADAVKEFAERLKRQVFSDATPHDYEILHLCIDGIAKEFTEGESNGLA